ncbi:MAG: response regulator transcription factor [Clostridia bacterium]|nr:response regulator transcription factor [Clostridia bacterium]
MNRILIVEDELAISEGLKSFLESEGFSCGCAQGQSDALETFENGEYDLVLMDVSLKDGNGFVLCSAFKRMKDTPIIFLTASGDEHSTVMGLELGAEDYIAKPFRPRELLLRIKNVLRRTGYSQTAIKLGNVCVDTEKGLVTKNGEEIHLSALEYRLLLAFINNRGRVMTRAALLEHIWDAAGDYVNDNTLTVYIKRLRDKLEDDPQEPTVILTARGMGYKLAD